MAVKAEDVMEYVGIEAEYADDVQKRRIDRALKAAQAWLKGAVGEKVDMNDPRAEELVLMAAGELFETRTLTDDRLSKYAGAKVLASINRMAGDTIMQLKYCINEQAEEGTSL
jgi:hypothetical protein